VVSVDYNYFLDTDHGASYFRRWHGQRTCSGTLLVHKATHHYDEMNWWLDSEPEEVFGYGRLVKYGSNGPFRGRRCMKCPHKDKCQFYWDITKSKQMMDLYVNCEEADGYIRDNCLYRHAIDIYDTMAVQARYANGVHMTYSLNAFMPYEGFRVCFNGLKGRLDARVYHQTPWDVPHLAEVRISKIFGKTEVKTIQSGGGGHWGADNVMKDMIFKENIPDELGQSAGSRAGAMSILIGIAARTSIDMKEPVKIHDLVDFG